jgi:hypothetical protein
LLLRAGFHVSGYELSPKAIITYADSLTNIAPSDAAGGKRRSVVE